MQAGSLVPSAQKMRIFDIIKHLRIYNGFTIINNQWSCKFIEKLSMHQIQPPSPKLKSKTQMRFSGFKSQTLNPELNQTINFPYQEDFKILTLTASRAKKKLQETATTKYRFSSSSISARQRSTTSFRASDTISSMVRRRHSVEQKTKNLNNLYSYLSNKFSTQSRKKQQQRMKQNKLYQTINLNKSQKSLFQSAIRQNNEKVYLNKLKSKSEIVDHRNKLHQVIQSTLLEKTKAGEVGRGESEVIDQQIEVIKKEWHLRNKEAVIRGKLAEEQLQKQRAQREVEKKKIAEENYKRKWMQQFLNKQKIQRENRIRSRKLGKKIQNLLEQTQQSCEDR